MKIHTASSKSLVKLVIAGVIPICPQLSAQVPEQESPVMDFSVGGNKLTWEGVVDRTYFLQWSNDLVDWNYHPFLQKGDGTMLEFSFELNGGDFFRLKYTDVPVDDPLTADFDFDGASNGDELFSLNTDPFVFEDIDSDGVSDHQEQLIIDHDLNDAVVDFTDVTATTDFDTDGVSDLIEYRQGFDPNDPSDVLTNGATSGSISGTTGNDLLNGGIGDDRLDGGTGNDTYLWSWGDGNDTIPFDGNGDNVLLFGEGVLPEHVSFFISSGINQNLTITLSHPSNVDLSGSIVISSWFNSVSGGTRGHWQIEFADGTVLDGVLLVTDGADRITGTDGADEINGGLGNDTLAGGLGDDILRGEGGNDHLSGNDGNDHLIGGQGDDSLLGGNGNDLLNGGIGDDRLDGGTGNDTYLWSWGDGNDTIPFDGNGDNVLLFGEGVLPEHVSFFLSSGTNRNLTITLSHPSNVDLSGSIVISSWSNSASGGARDHWQIEFADGTVLEGALLGTDANDNITGTDGDDDVSARRGADFVDGGLGNDTISGGDDNDRLLGSEGDDVLTGGSGNDALTGGTGADLYHYSIGDGDDVIFELFEENIKNRLLFGLGITSADVNFDGDGSDLVIRVNDPSAVVAQAEIRFPGWYLLGARQSWLFEFEDGEILDGAVFATRGNDTFIGMTGDDTLRGGDGLDRLVGNDGADQLFGENGDDQLEGGNGDDLLIGGIGNDVIIGGAGSDRYFYSQGDGNDTYQEDEDGGENVIVFGAEISSNDLRINRLGDDIIISFLNELEDSIVLENGFDVIDFNGWAFEFADGTSLILSSDLIVPSSEGPDQIIGSDIGELIDGFAGDDTIIGNAGDDNIKGGLGFDILSGGEGSDTYLFSLDKGTDRILYEQSEKLVGDIDRISYSADITEESLILVHNGEDNELYVVDVTTLDLIVVIEGWDTDLVDELLPIQEMLFDSGAIWNVTDIKSRSADAFADDNNDGINNWESIELNLALDDDDYDGDGLSNEYEHLIGTNPFVADSDGDGVSDSLDADPRDPLVTTFNGLPASSTLEITIDQPLNAVLID